MTNNYLIDYWHPKNEWYRLDEVIDCAGIDLHKIPGKAVRAIEREKNAVDANKGLFNEPLELQSTVYMAREALSAERRARRAKIIQTDPDALTAEELGF